MAEPAKVEQNRVRATVARGRTIAIPVANGPRDVIGHTPDGKPIEAQAKRHYGPGQEVSLPAEEVKTLRKLGYLIDPNQNAAPIADGPNFVETGAAAKVA